MRFLAVGLVGLLIVGCSPASQGARPAANTASATKTATTEVTSSTEPQAAPKEELPWATFSPETFAKAKAERKFIVMDGSAEWCHWCHVMEATTYHDAGVRAVLDKSFIAVKVDIDSRPDLAERYGDYGWPATIMFSPDAEEIGKYRGYIAPEKFVGILNELVASGKPESETGYVIGASHPQPKTPLGEDMLNWIQHNTDLALDEYWDEEQGGWGKQQKAPLGWDNAWLLDKAGRGDATAKKKALASLDAQAALIDPVWGGIYQYSAARTWDHPHFEKLMTFQAPALDNYATAYRITGDQKQLARAKAMLGYIDRFLKGADGGFYTTQDADVNAHDRTKPFVDGHDYYVLGEKDRLSKGIPRVDTNEYGRENGLAIAAYASMYEATKDPAVLASAEKAARSILATHKTKRGGIAHAAIANNEEPKQLFLSDNAAFGWGLTRLYEATHDEKWLTEAKSIADFMLKELPDDSGGGLFASTQDPDAVGVFAKRRVPFEDEVMALRMLARIAKRDAKYAPPISRILRSITVPEEINGRGRWLGDYLLALEETKTVRAASASKP